MVSACCGDLSRVEAVFHCCVTIMEKMYLVIFLETVACREDMWAPCGCLGYGVDSTVAPYASCSQERADVIW